MLLVPFIGFLTGFGFAAFGVLIAAVAKTIDNFNYVTSAVLTPHVPRRRHVLPDLHAARRRPPVAQVNPLYHCVQLVRDASLGELQLADLGHAGVLLAFVAADVAPGDLAAGQAPDRLSERGRADLQLTHTVL